MLPYPLTAHDLVADVLQDLDAVTEAVRARFGGLGDAQLAWQPSPERWGVGHCLVHLTRTNELYRAVLAPALRAGRDAGRMASAPLHGRWFGRRFTRWMSPGGGIKVRTPKLLRPRQRSVSVSPLEAFFAEQHRLRALAEEARDLDLDGILVRSPVASWVRLTAGDAFRSLAAHEARHLAQAQRVLEDPRFPS